MGGRERRLEARPRRLAFDRFEETRFFAGDIGAGAEQGMQFEVYARILDVLPEKSEPIA
jgi:hypothetical protein